MDQQEFSQLEMRNYQDRLILVVSIITLAVNGVPSGPLRPQLRQLGLNYNRLKTPIAEMKLGALLPVEVTPEINDEAMQGHLGSDFYDKGGEFCTSSPT